MHAQLHANFSHCKFQTINDLYECFPLLFTAEPEETEAPVVVLPSCPSGPARTSEYLRQEQEKLCEMRCEVRTSVNG